MNMNRSEMDEAQIRAIEEHQISQGFDISPLFLLDLSTDQQSRFADL